MINIARQFDMCDVCKLDREKICDYSCIKQREDCILRFFTCPKFIYDDGKALTNGELVSRDMMDDLKSISHVLWNKLVENEEFSTVDDFQEWLTKSTYLN